MPNAKRYQLSAGIPFFAGVMAAPRKHPAIMVQAFSNRADSVSESAAISQCGVPFSARRPRYKFIYLLARGRAASAHVISMAPDNLRSVRAAVSRKLAIELSRTFAAPCPAVRRLQALGGYTNMQPVTRSEPAFHAGLAVRKIMEVNATPSTFIGARNVREPAAFVSDEAGNHFTASDEMPFAADAAPMGCRA